MSLTLTKSQEHCRLSLRESTYFRRAKGDKVSAIGREPSGIAFLYRQADACRSPIVSLMIARSITSWGLLSRWRCGRSAFSQCRDNVQSHGADGGQESAQEAHHEGEHHALSEDARAEAERECDFAELIGGARREAVEIGRASCRERVSVLV